MTSNEQFKTCFNYIDGEWLASSNNQIETKYNPSHKSEIVGVVPMSEREDLHKAIAAANQAKQGWRKLTGATRGDYLFKIADQLQNRLEEIAETLSKEMGKPLAEAKGETGRAIAILRYYAGEGLRKTGDVIPSTDAEGFLFTTRSPLGVVGVISPWNFPIAIPVWKIAPALIYGNTVILKPAQEASITATLLFECIHAANLPAGVANLVLGKGSIIGQGLAEHPDVNAITFTGSNEIGKQIGLTAFARGAKYQLEMGGKNPIIIAEDADLDLAVQATISGGFRSTGQKCTATSRVIVVGKVYEAFKQKLMEKVKDIRVGNAMLPSSWMGPVANAKQLNTVQSYIKLGLEEGAELLYGGEAPSDPECENGYYIQPTIFDKVTSQMTLSKEEIFGPVIGLIQVNSLEEAIHTANDVEFGLSASIFTKDIGTMMRFIQDMDAGLIRVNSETAGVELQAPFGGMKHSSSHSREQGTAAIEFFTSIKTVFVKP
ncbi:alpha-ketoglutaric semialdehyde dehydrogenase GucD [Paenibacillus koleovorans]|uniref:alpha-ketoglutaric semialdehyde dehydrogenase GucD n=1 Tax=Paenibacillus koleovorans TaxID=121608 RepID=UPI000FD716CD|nr:alpha-ketoglutaric semialdehyde dehydrogenase GucD [Paenibacillus koleovorans]